MTHISSICLGKRQVQLSDGQIVPITNWLLGDMEVLPPCDCDRIVAGPDGDGMWYGALLSEEILDE